MLPLRDGPARPARTGAAPASPADPARGGLTVAYAVPGEGGTPSAAIAPPLCAVVHEGGAPAPAGTGIVVRVPLVQLGGSPVAEQWHAPGSVQAARADGWNWAAAGELLFGATELPAGSGVELEDSAREAYRGALEGATGLGFPHLLRAWNVVPAINRPQDGLERYRRFCRGRAEAFEAHHGAGFEALLPASSAVGSAEGPLVMWFLAAREPGVHHENPRQVSAWAYPARYGPRSPSFARATRCPAGAAGGRLLLSGTASIVGHRSVHLGDVSGQLDETLRNLETLLAAGDELAAVRVYVRHAADAGQVRDALERRLGAELPALYLCADICREELLVEVEGVAWGRVPGTAHP